jgi:hypothetical protein
MYHRGIHPRLRSLGIPEDMEVGQTDPNVTRNSTLSVVCGCGATSTLKVSSIIRTIDRIGFYRCLSCGIKAKHRDPSYKESHSLGIFYPGLKKEKMLSQRFL